MKDALALLAEAMPPSRTAGDGEDQPRRARAALAIIVEAALRSKGQVEPFTADPADCPNCGKLVASARSPYCSCECKEESGFVRQMRSGLAHGSILVEEKQVALGQKFWRLIGGGLPLRLSLIPEKAWAKFLSKSAACAICGAPATTIDNIGGG